MAPTQDAMVVRHHPQTGERHLDLLKWGLLPYFTKDPTPARRPINARAETVRTYGMFKSAFAKRRCLVPADAFYEWKPVEGGKQPYAIARQDGQAMAFAGLWERFRWPDDAVERTFTIITTNANTVVGELHDRMPVVLELQDWPTWLGEVDDDPGALLKPAGDDILKAWPVSKQVNSPKKMARSCWRRQLDADATPTIAQPDGWIAMDRRQASRASGYVGRVVIQEALPDVGART
jgi:putative SOS response-associated peptidase YedK